MSTEQSTKKYWWTGAFVVTSVYKPMNMRDADVEFETLQEAAKYADACGVTYSSRVYKRLENGHYIQLHAGKDY